MANWLIAMLEIVKITVPALVIFFTVYYMLKQFFDGQYRLRSIELRQNQQKNTVPLKLQAYERLSLFCERISIPSLMLRVRGDKMTAAQLRIAMMVGIQKEFEHNITQQVYVSDNLWQIVKIARDDTIHVINNVYQQVDPIDDDREYSHMLLQAATQREIIPLDKALQAVKKEAGLLLN